MSDLNNCSFYRDTTPVKSTKNPQKTIGIDVWEQCDHCEQAHHIMRAIFPLWWNNYDIQRFVSGLNSATVLDFSND